MPLTSQQGVAITDVPVTLHTENNVLYSVRWDTSASGNHQRQQLASAVGNATLAGHGDRLLAVYVQTATQRQLISRESDDGGRTWGAPQVIGTAPAGPALPSACLFQAAGSLRRLVVWSAQPSQSDGPLVVARDDGSGGWLTPTEDTSLRTSGAALSCPDDQMPEVIWRDHRDGATGLDPALWQADIDMSSGAVQNARKLVQPGNDPSQCRAGARRFVGFHTGVNTAHLGYSDDAWQSLSQVDLDTATTGTQIDDNGKFVAVACEGDTVAVAWGDWPTRADADAVAPTRQLAMRISRDRGASWSVVAPAGSEQDQGPATLAVRNGQIVVMWKAPSAVRLAVMPAN